MVSPTELRDGLIAAGAKKVTVLNEHECLITLVEIYGSRFVVAVFEGERALYAKVIPEDEAPSLACTNLLYSPKGLYVFASSLEELCRGIIAKAKSFRV